MPKYRQTWHDKVTGLKYRLELLTYDTNYDAAHTDLTGREIIAIGTMTREFDELPVGLMKPPTLTVTIDFGSCSSTLQTYLRNAESGDLKNLWTLSVSYDGGTSYEIEFAGVQSRTESSQYTLTTAGQMIVEYELEDLFWSMLSLDGGADLAGLLDGNTTLPFETEVYDIDVFSPSQAADSVFALKPPDLKVRPHPLGDLIDKYNGWLRQVLPYNYLHYTNAGDIAAVTVAGPITAFGDAIISEACTFFRQGSAGSSGTLPRIAGSPIAAADLLVPAEVHNDDGMIGGYVSANDELSVAQYQSGADWLKDLCETFAVKMRWRYEVATTGGGLDYVKIITAVGPVFESLEVAAGTVTIGTDVIAGDITVEEGAAVIAKAEAEWSGGDEDMGNMVTTNPGTRAQRTFTVRTTVHNNPTVKARIVQKGVNIANPNAPLQDYVRFGLTQTNLLSYVTDVGAYAKVHETVYIDDGIVQSGYSDPLSEIPNVESGKLSLEKFTLWCLDVQSRTGLPLALTKFYADRFGDRNQALVTLTMPMASIEGTAYDVGGKLAISGLTGLTHLNTSNGQVVSHERDYEAGTMTLGVLLCP